MTTLRQCCALMLPAIMAAGFAGCAMSGPGVDDTVNTGSGSDGDSTTTPPQPAEDALADFKAADVNPASPRYQEEVSPRDYLGQVTAWYFGHAT